MRTITARAVRLAGLSALLTSLAVTGFPAPQATATTARGTIAGRITDADSGKPVAGVRVTLADRSYSRELRHVTTGADGRYRFAKVSARSYLVYAGAPREFIPAYYGNTVHLGKAKPVKVTRKATFTRNIQLHRSAVLTGQVVDAGGNPIRPAADVDGLVSAWGRDTFSGESEEKGLDQDGRFRLAGFATGPLVVRYFDTNGRQASTVVKVTAGRETHVTLTATVPAPRGEGRLTGKVVASHPVLVRYATSKTSGDVTSTQPGENGAVGPAPVAPGRYTVWVAERNLPARVVTVTDGGTADFGTIVDGGQWTTLKGRIVHANGTACKSCHFRILDAHGYAGLVRTTDKQGYYRISGLAAGGYTIQVSAPRRRGGPGGDLRTRRAFTVPSGASVVTENVRLVEGYTVTGRVLYHGKPVGNALVAPRSAESSGRTDALGRFTIRYLQSGKYKVYVEEQTIGGYRPRLLTLTISGKSRSGVVFRLERGTLVPVS